LIFRKLENIYFHCFLLIFILFFKKIFKYQYFRQILRGVKLRKLRFRPVKFPRDELSHHYAIEWWYFNGILKDKKGNKYSYMDCFVKTDNKKVDMPVFNKIPLRTICYSHSLLSDIKAKKFHPRMGYFLVLSKDSFTKPLLFVNYTNHNIRGYFNNAIEETSKFNYRLKTEDFDLYLDSMKKPLLEGGPGFVDLKTRTTYYYSLSNLKTKGTIKINGKQIEVAGKSWLDHQWANVKYVNDKWTWFSIQLDNNTEIACFEYGEGKTATRSATISHPNNKQESMGNINLIPTGTYWKSPVTKANYPLSWRIEIPKKNIKLNVKPMLKTQEMIFGTINYWEGPLEVKGYFGKKKVKGQGFLELMDYPKGVSNAKILEYDAKKAIKELIRKK
jgi:predicted secreted hydrolase